MSISKKRHSLKFKLGFFAILLVVLVATSFSTFILQGQKKAIIRTQEANRFETAKLLRQVAREAILVDDDTDMVNYVNLLKRDPVIAYALVISPDSRVRIHTDPILIGDRLGDEPTKKALASRNRGSPLAQDLTLPKGRDVLDLSLPIMIGFSPPEYHGVIRIGFDKKAYEATIERAFKKEIRRIIGAFLISLLIGLIGAVFLATFITKPIDKLKEGSRIIGQGKLEHRINVKTNDELEELGDEFNLMAHKLGELDEMKTDFVSKVTHELRSPMTSIRGYMVLLLDGAAGPLSALQKDYLSVIKNNAVRLGRFIDNLLDVAKIEAHKLKLSPEIQDIHTLAHEMEVLFKPQVDEKKLTYKNNVPKDLVKGFVDKDRLAEVLINLSSNAIKFTPEGGQVTIEGAEKPNYIEMCVHDTGPGIPKEQIGSLFNKFVQIQNNKPKGSVKQQKGTGLGLTIAKGIVEAHGGKIWIESPGPSGKGTAFFFTIPKLTEEIKKKYKKD